MSQFELRINNCDYYSSIILLQKYIYLYVNTTLPGELRTAIFVFVNIFENPERHVLLFMLASASHR